LKKKANFSIEKLEPIAHAYSCFIPALFAHGNQDTFIAPSHSTKIKEKYLGDSNRITFEGTHISERPEFFFASASIFFSNNLLVDSDFRDDENPIVKEQAHDEKKRETISTFTS